MYIESIKGKNKKKSLIGKFRRKLKNRDNLLYYNRVSFKNITYFL